MNHALVHFVSRMLVVCLAGLPFHAQAELIGTHQPVSAAQAQQARATVAGKLEAFGVATDSALARVAALTDAEAISLAARVADAPAGAVGGETFGLIFVAAFLFWRFVFSDQAQAEGKK